MSKRKNREQFQLGYQGLRMAGKGEHQAWHEIRNNFANDPGAIELLKAYFEEDPARKEASKADWAQHGLLPPWSEYIV